MEEGWLGMHVEEALRWYEGAALLGHAAAARRMVLVERRLHTSTRGWPGQLAAAGDVDAALNLGVMLIEGRGFDSASAPAPWPSPSARQRAPRPGSASRAEVERAREGLRWLRHAAACGDAAAKYPLQHGLRVASAATTAEALARLEARWRVPTLPASWAEHEQEAIERAWAALAVGSAAHAGGPP